MTGFTTMSTPHGIHQKVPIFEIYKDTEEKWRWRLIANNGKIICVPGEAFETQENAKANIDFIKRVSPGAEIKTPSLLG